MLRQLRFDGYKLIHSRMLWIVYAVVFALALVIPIQEAALHNSVFSALTDVTPPVMLIQISVVLFAAFFVGADFRSGYIKTVVSRVEWAKYILSKMIYVFVFCILWICLFHLLQLAIIPMGGGGVVTVFESKVDDVVVYEREKYNFGLLYCKLLWTGLSAFAYGMLVMFVLTASKSTIAALVCGLVYCFVFPSTVFPEINSLLINSFGVKEQMYIIEKYTISDGGYWFIDTCTEQSNSMLKVTTGDHLLYYFGILFYTMLSVGFSILICYKRKRKN